MQSIFKGYHRPSKAEIDAIWKDAIIYFDANVLLNLYRYSQGTRDTLLELMEKFKDRICFPHQAALEYNRNRLQVIAEQARQSKVFLKELGQIESTLGSASKHPFLSAELTTELNAVFEKVRIEVDRSIVNLNTYMKSDPVYDRLAPLSEDRITPAFTVDQLTSIIKEGADRYKAKVPPGYQDEKNKEGDNKYGDLILWKQVMNAAKEKNLPVIFITDDSKEDWWWKVDGDRTVGPRPELKQEMFDVTGQELLMYASDQFVNYGQKFLKQQVNSRAVEEIQQVNESVAGFHFQTDPNKSNPSLMELAHQHLLQTNDEYRNIDQQIKAREKRRSHFKQRELEILTRQPLGEPVSNEVLNDFYTNSEQLKTEETILSRLYEERNDKFSWYRIMKEVSPGVPTMFMGRQEDNLSSGA